jgi:hypothetical protein
VIDGKAGDFVTTIAQLRAVLAILDGDMSTASIEGEIIVGRDPALVQAELTGLLHHIVSTELRRAIMSAPDAREFSRRWSAASAAPGDAADETGTDQAQFDVHWLRHRIDAVAAAGCTDPVPILLDAAGRALVATEALLALTRRPLSPDADSRWQLVLDNLAGAYHLINDERTGHATTQRLS